MKYIANLGIFGNIQKLIDGVTAVNSTANRADAAATELKETEALTLELAADHEARICMMELGV